MRRRIYIDEYMSWFPQDSFFELGVEISYTRTPCKRLAKCYPFCRCTEIRDLKFLTGITWEKLCVRLDYHLRKKEKVGDANLYFKYFLHRIFHIRKMYSPDSLKVYYGPNPEEDGYEIVWINLLMNIQAELEKDVECLMKNRICAANPDGNFSELQRHLLAVEHGIDIPDNYHFQIVSVPFEQLQFDQQEVVEKYHFDGRLPVAVVDDRGVVVDGFQRCSILKNRNFQGNVLVSMLVKN